MFPVSSCVAVVSYYLASLGGVTPFLGVVIAVAVGLGTALAYFRSSASQVWERTAAGYKEQVVLLEGENKKLTVRVSVLEREVGLLKAQTDLSAFEQRQNVRFEAVLHELASSSAAVVAQLELLRVGK